MGNKPRRIVTNWDNEPEKRIADRLAAVVLFTEYYHRAHLVPDSFNNGVQAILETEDPKAVKYEYAAMLGLIVGDKP